MIDFPLQLKHIIHEYLPSMSVCNFAFIYTFSVRITDGIILDIWGFYWGSLHSLSGHSNLYLHTYDVRNVCVYPSIVNSYIYMHDALPFRSAFSSESSGSHCSVWWPRLHER